MAMNTVYQFTDPVNNDVIFEAYSVEYVDAEVTNINTSITNINTTITALDGRVTVVEGNVATINTNITNLTTALNNAITDLTAYIDQEVASAATDVTALQAQVDTIFDGTASINVNNASVTNGNMLLTSSELTMDGGNIVFSVGGAGDVLNVRHIVFEANTMWALDMNGGTVVNVGAPINNSDAATKQYVDDAIAAIPAPIPPPPVTGFLPLAGGTMTGPITMGSNIIDDLADPINDQDAATKHYVDDAISNLPSGTYLELQGGTMAGSIDMGSYSVINLATPINNNDAATKNYVDTVAAQGVIGADPTFNSVTLTTGGTAAGSPLMTQSSSDLRYLQLSGGTMTGDINLNALANIDNANQLGFSSNSVLSIASRGTAQEGISITAPASVNIATNLIDFGGASNSNMYGANLPMRATPGTLDVVNVAYVSGQITTVNGKITAIEDVIPSSASTTNLLATASDITTALTNINTDISDLTADIATINGKIPASASTTNQLSTSSDLTSALTPINTSITNNTNDIATINSKIPTVASATNQLVDDNSMNDAVQGVTARQLSADAAGNGFATRAALLAGPYYYRGASATPTEHDFAIVIADEDAPSPFTNGQTRHAYDGTVWAYSFGINETPFTSAQNAAINSGITSTLVTQIGTNESDITTLKSDMTTAQSDITTLKSDMTTAQGDITTAQGNITTINGQISTINSSAVMTSGINSTYVAQITTNANNITTLQGYNIPAIAQDATDAKAQAAAAATAAGLKLPLAGGTMTGAINMGGSQLQNVGNITGASGTIVLNSGTTANYDINMNQCIVANLKAPTQPNDAARKAYVDAKIIASATDPGVGSSLTSGTILLVYAN